MTASTSPMLLSAALQEVAEDLGISARLNDDAFWAARELELETTRKAAVAREVAHRRSVRAQVLRDAGFPAIAVDGALALAAEADCVRPGVSLRRTAAVERAVDFAKDRHTSLHLAGGVGLRNALMLAGGVGAGKTTAATWIALTSTDSAPAFIRATELERIGRTYGHEKRLQELIRTSTSLVLDDLGAEVLDGRGVFEALICEVIDAFYGDRKMLVITANMRQRRAAGKPGAEPTEPPQFRERYGERVFSRFREAGKWADCGATDLRAGVAQ